ncbi:DNA repair protein RecN [Pareuzebyella sediminis]|uniref:DNA repair protein RecN n=1 Tax=Pareuzebyella sediminis TaxID=2607998 RepID=UPI0011ECD81A|nr:DNA repair protein RecN [Pareuzebyella sediminis]
MLVHLTIKNYALIDDLNVTFSEGFTCITGETGAGKSILLGGLSLVLGKRADLSSLRDKSEKCIIEAEFEIGKYDLQSFFEKNDLDYEGHTIIRREIHPSGKSRAFINDSPVNLTVLAELGDRLIDVHSQHQTLRLADNDFQFMVIDALAGNRQLLENYRHLFSDYGKIEKELTVLIDRQRDEIKEHDYNLFLLKELEEAPLKEGIQQELEEQYEQLSNIENIMELLSQGFQLLNDEQIGVSNLLAQLKQVSNKLSGFGGLYADLNERIQSVVIEVDDIATELQSFHENTEANPQLLEDVNGKLQRIYDLQKKHGVATVSELLAIRNELDEKIAETESLDSAIVEKRKAVEVVKNAMEDVANTIHVKRRNVLPRLKEQLSKSLGSLGMPSASFKIEVQQANVFKTNGKDDLTFLFSANKGADFGELKKTASGGELSRIMLVIKAILAEYENLPTMMFDEIDTGVSGEISNSMGDIMQAMSKNMQVFSITHLPQVASKGNHHYKVFKVEADAVTKTQMKKLDENERIIELAEMLGGKQLSDSAIAHAKQLLN